MSSNRFPSRKPTEERIVRRNKIVGAKNRGNITTDLRARLSKTSSLKELQVAKATLRLQSVYTRKLESLLETYRETQKTDQDYIQILENLTQTKDKLIESKKEQIFICHEQIEVLQSTLSNINPTPRGERKEIRSYRKYTKSLEKTIANQAKLIDHLQNQSHPDDFDNGNSTSSSPQQFLSTSQISSQSSTSQISSQSSNSQISSQSSTSQLSPQSSSSQLSPQSSFSHPQPKTPSSNTTEDGKFENGKPRDIQLEDGEVL